jgi:glucokinase-like ROK family protein
MTLRSQIRTGDQTYVREMNLSIIMKCFRERVPISRAALAEVLGLNKTTVSSLVEELIAKGLVHEIGFVSNGIGRPAILLELNPAGGQIVSCEIGVDFISVISTDFSANIIWKKRVETTNLYTDQEAILNYMLTLLKEGLDASRDSSERVLGIAVGVPGLVDQKNGVLLMAPNLGWKNIPLVKIMQAEFNPIPIFIDNEANMAALGEVYFGAAQGYDEVLYISAGVGLGGAIVRNGELYRGHTGFAAEFGHMTLYPDGEQCNCGNRGCWETVASQRAVFRLIRGAISQGQLSLLTDEASGDLSNLTIPMVVQSAQAKDRVAIQTLEQVGRDLGIGIASLVNA